MLNDILLKTSLKTDIIKVLTNRNNSTDESQTVEDAIANVAEELASAITNAVSAYVKSATVPIGPSNISVTSTTGPCVVTPLTPAKLQ